MQTTSALANAPGRSVFDTSLRHAETVTPNDPNDLWQVERAEAHARQVEADAAAMAQRQAEERAAAEAAAIEQRRADEAARVAAEAERARSAARAAAAAAATPVPTRAPPTPPPTAEATAVNALVDARGWIQEAAASAGWPGGLGAKLERVVMCESSGRTTAVAPAGYVGLMQVAPWLHGPVPADAVGQLAQAYGVFLREGWGAWPVCGRL